MMDDCDGISVETPVYMDFNASTPTDENVLKEMLPYFSEKFGNPSSSHSYGESVKGALRISQEAIAELLDGNPTSVFFTSGATESLNWGIRCGAISQRKRLMTEREVNKMTEEETDKMQNGRKEKYKIVSCQMEHVATLKILSYLQEVEDFDVEYVKVESSGVISLQNLKQILTENTVLVSIIFADGEVGAIQPIKKIVQIVRENAPNALFHSDASQALGKTRVSVTDTDVDLLTMAGHKIFAPKGIGCLYIKKGINMIPLILGGNHQEGLRGGTENVASLAGLGVACQIISKNLNEHIKHFEKINKILREVFIKTLINLTGKSEIELQEYVIFNNVQNSELYLPNTLSISIKNANANKIVSSLKEELCISAGTSCHSLEESNILKAMQIPSNWRSGTIRLSTGRCTTVNEVFWAGNKLAKKLIELKYITCA